MTFKDRREAGCRLGESLNALQMTSPVVVLGLPRGGVPVAAEVADRLAAPLDILTVRKIGAPGHEELACGAVAPGGVIVWNDRVLQDLGLTPGDLEQTVYNEQAEIGKRERSIRTQSTPILSLKGHSVVIIDDGVATGATMRAAIRAVKSQKPLQVIVGLPVGPVDTCSELEHQEVVKVVCVQPIPSGEFGSVGQWYDDFSQGETEECRDILVRSRGSQDRHTGTH
jgi:putative phosphoribosyl transferase